MSSKVKKRISEEEEKKQEELKKQANIAKIILEVIVLTVAVIVGFSLARTFNKPNNQNEGSSTTAYVIDYELTRDEISL